MPEPISFFVPGIPRPGGSKRAFVLRRRDGSIVFRPNGAPAVNVTDDAKGNADWKRNVSFFARQAYEGEPLRGALSVTVIFSMPRIKGHFRSDGAIKPNAPRWHTVKPDATKLMRSTEDALTGIVWADDATIAEQYVRKVYAEKPGAYIKIEELENRIKRPANVAAPLFQPT